MKSRFVKATIIVLGVCLCAPLLSDDSRGDVSHRWRLIQSYDGQFIVRGQDDPEAPSQPLDTGPDQPLEIDAPRGRPRRPNFEERAMQQIAEETVSDGEAKTGGQTDIGGLLQQSNRVQTVSTQRRGANSMDPYIRGYRSGQIYSQAGGSQWLPARRDLDSMLSKIDPSLMRGVTIIPGPYGLRYGPGFSFIDVSMIDTPRYFNGYESHARIGYTLRTNGGQNYGRVAAYGGNADWGYILSWGGRKGSDYKPGNDAQFAQIPSSYSTQNWMLQLGRDLSADSRVEFRYERVDDSDHEYAAQIFDVNFMGTDAVNLSYISEDPCKCSTLTVDTWFNSTRYNGDTTRAGKRRPYPVVDRVEYALDALAIAQGEPGSLGTTGFVGSTFGDLSTTGARAVKKYGNEQETQVSLGADFRYTTQKIGENIVISNNPLISDVPTNMPRAESIDPGLFTEVELPWLSCLTTRVGGRIDWVRTTARASDVRAVDSQIDTQIPFFNQNDTLYGFYVQNELLVSPAVTINLDAGHGQRAPSLVDRYADAVFLGIMQSGFNRVIGNPRLQKETAWQVDGGINVDYCGWSGGIRAFHSWIDNYNLYQGELVADPSGARILFASNAEMVTLTGFESYLEVPVTERLTTFGTLKYLRGRDHDIRIGVAAPIDQPLYGIVPLEGRVGLRLADRCGGDNWGLEFAARIVDAQDQVARLRQGSASIVGLAPLEEATPGFTTFYVRGYWNPTETLSIVGGVENLFDRSYQEHLDLRLLANPGIAPPDPRGFNTRVYSPGITPYVGVEWTR